MSRRALRQIRASAGSGKTYALTGDFLDLLAEAGPVPRRDAAGGCLPAAPPETEGHDWPEILAVTFTNRAATEMKDRVLTRLKDMALGVVPAEAPWTRERAARAVESLLRDFGALNIRTIDSLLHLIVRLAALDLRLPPDFDPVFDENAIFAPLLDELAERAREGDAELAEAFSRACRDVLQYSDFQGFLAGSKVRDRIAALAVWLLHHPGEAGRLSDPASIAHRLAELYANFRLLARQLSEALDSGRATANAHLKNALARCMDPSCPDAELPVRSRMLRKSCLDECLLKASRGTAGPVAEGLYLRLTDATRSLDAEGAVLRAALRHMPFLRLAVRALDELPAFESRTGTMPASLVPSLADRALGGEYGVSESFCRMGSRLTHILVDEFQDTSVAQWLALRPLVLEALSRGGSLSIVGDVKQAIYGWRGGEAALFDLVPRDPDLRRLAPEPEQGSLDRNWRSREAIVTWNNAVFSRLGDPAVAAATLDCLLGGPLPSDAEPDDIRPQAAAMLVAAFAHAAQDPDPAKPGGLIRITRLPADPESGRGARRDGSGSEADGQSGNARIAGLLTERVRELGSRRPWGDICVLTRTNLQTSLAASWLLAEGIPVVTQGSLLLAEQPLIAQSVALLTFLNSPDDDNAFWTVLTGTELLPPLPGPNAPDTAALRDWAARRAGLHRPEGTLARAFRADWPDQWQAVFAPLHDTAGLLTPYDTVREIYHRWRVADRHPEASGFLLRFLEVLHLAEQEGLSDLAGFLDYWAERGGEEKAPLPETMDAVSVMTVHKAKGLQFEAVVVPWHNFSIKADSSPTAWEGGGLTVIAPLSPAMGDPWRQSMADNAREALHLLYVAWTRAVSELHCFLPAPESGGMAAALAGLIDPLRAALSPGGTDDEWIIGDPPSSGTGRKTEDPLSLSSAGEDADLTEFSGEVRSDDWRPMAWLPRLKIFRSPLQDWTYTARRRGTLMHHCLEMLHLTGKPALDAATAARHGLDTFPLPVPDREAVEHELTRALTWYAGLPEAAHWLAFGTPEHTLLDERGGAHRVDLLVDDGREMVAVEYKTGTPGALPDPAHAAQLGGYLALLRAAGDLPCRGVLVYLDRQTVFPLEAEIDPAAPAASDRRGTA